VDGHYESHFLKVNLPEQDAAFWWKFTITQPLSGMGPARFEVWAIFFDAADPSNTCATRETFDATVSSVARERLACVFGNNVLEHGKSHGRLDSGAGFEWDIAFDVPDEGFRHFPMPGMYEAALPKAKTLTPAIDVVVRGTARVGDRTFDLEHPGMQGHNWGVKHADSWVWVHCNVFQEDGSAVFEAVSSRIKMGPMTTPQLTILHFSDGATTITVNGWVEMVRATSDLEGLRWRFRGSTGDWGIEGLFKAAPDRFVGLNYQDPDGIKTACLNSKIADGELRILRRDNGVWRLERSLTARGTAALEIGLKNETRGVRMHVE
jgi:hypothetical protein